ncbi:MAG TPA: helix-turn-helix transcriptional regulator, partial [Vicinamibacterales bacterium]|nr:helix-turn-helix transcriptional regulator [Vicinamibacterales bacterium]
MGCRRRNCSDVGPAMSDRQTFGPRLRRERERRGISLDTIATVTKVSAELWEGLERNDFSRWPSGIFARAFVRDYARAVGLDADDVVDEFCRLFPIGDRRAARLIQAQAQLIGHSTTYADSAVPPEGDRRAASRAASENRTLVRVAPRALAVAVDTGCTLMLGGVGALLA